MSDIIIMSKQQCLILDPPSRTISIHPDGGVRPLEMAAAIAAAIAPLPKGLLKRQTLTTSFVTTSTHTTYQDEGLSLTLDEPTGRALRIMFAIAAYPNGGAQAMRYNLLRNGVSQKTFSIPAAALDAVAAHHATFGLLVNTSVGGAGVVWKLQLKAETANTAVTSFGSASEPRQMWIEDIGLPTT